MLGLFSIQILDPNQSDPNITIKLRVPSSLYFTIDQCCLLMQQQKQPIVPCRSFLSQRSDKYDKKQL